MAEIADIVVSWSVTTAALFALLAWDERRLARDPDGERLARAWPIATKRVAVVVGGIFCLPIHFARTRRSLSGLLLGLAWMVAAGALSILTSASLAWLLGIEE